MGRYENVIIINPDLVQKIRNRLQEIEKMEKYSHDNRLNIIYRLNTLNSAWYCQSFCVNSFFSFLHQAFIER